MAPIKITWTRLLNLTELEFVPDYPPSLRLSEELAFTLSILSAATRHDRKLLRCDDNGALLVSNPWNGLIAVQTDELYVNAGTPDSFIATVTNKGVLLATPAYVVKANFVRAAGGGAEVIYIAPNSLFWYPSSVYSVTIDDIPVGGGSSFYVGVTTFN